MVYINVSNVVRKMDVIKNKVLFITYDGLTDPLGQSQILPYIKGIAKCGYNFTILSFEKPQKLEKLKSKIENLCQEDNITWVYKKYNSGVPILSKYWDKLMMQRTAIKLYKKHKYNIIHCRSYISSETGLLLKQKYGAKFIFDMRGFWADEKKDGGSWNTKNPIFNYIYNFYKEKEKQYIQYADAIVSLTNAGKNEIEKWPFYSKITPIYVVPCSVDTNLFKQRTISEKQQAKGELLKIGKNTFVISYLGALGTWYCLPQMLQLFVKIKSSHNNAKFLILSQTPLSYIETEISKTNLLLSDFIIKEVARELVPKYLAASDINLSFIKPVYSKISSSPTKLGEVLAMGIPVITNSGVGDVKEIVEQINGGIIIDGFSNKELERAAKEIPNILTLDETSIAHNTKNLLSLDLALQTYLLLYKNL